MDLCDTEKHQLMFRIIIGWGIRLKTQTQFCRRYTFVNQMNHKPDGKDRNIGHIFIRFL